MKKSIVLLALLPCLAPAQEETEPELVGTLKFANRDRISGHPEGLDAEGHLKWQASFLKEPIPIRPSTILEMRLEGEQPVALDVGHHALLTLTNGDTLRGQLDALDEEHVTLKTWYGGNLKIKRTMASNLEILRAERAVYSGPADFESWNIKGEPDSWSMNAGVLTSSKGAGIAREIDFPDKCRIGFDVAWRSGLRLRVLLFSDDGDDTQPDNCYDLVCQRRFVYLRKRWMTLGSGGSRIVGQANIESLATKENARFDFYIDRTVGTIALYIDGAQAQVWTDQDPKVGKLGNWLHFISEDFFPIQVSRIRVSPWTGDLPENVNTAALEEQEDAEGQLIRLQNGDLVIGEVGQIANGVLDIKTKFCDMKIPVDRMRTVDLSTGEYEEPIRKEGDVRAWLREGGRVTFRLDTFDRESLSGYSQTFGDATFKLSSFSRIEFNIYDDELESMRGTNNW
jgi:hypothetical protein